MVRWLPSRSTLAASIAPILGAALTLSSIGPSAAWGDCPDPPTILVQPRSWVRGYEQPVTFSFRVFNSLAPQLQSGDFTWFKDGAQVNFSTAITTVGDTVNASLHLNNPRPENNGLYKVRILHRCQTGPATFDTVFTDTFRLTVNLLQTPPPLAVVFAGSTQVTVPAALTLDDDENVFIARETEREVQKFDRNGRLLLSWTLHGTGPGGSGITFDNDGNLLVVVGPKVQKYTATGQFISEFTAGNPENGRTHDPFSIAVDRLGFVYVGDYNSGHIQRFTAQGTFVNAWGQLGSNLRIPGEFIHVSGILVDSLLQVYVVDQEHEWVQIFHPNGNILEVWDTPGQDPGEFVWPSSIDQDRFGRIFITDKYNANIQAFDSSQTLRMKWHFGGNPIGVRAGRRGSIFGTLDYALNNNVHRWGDCDRVVVEQDPTSVLIEPGGTAQFHVEAWGTPLLQPVQGNDFIYKWRRNGIALPSNSHFSGSTTATLTVNSITVADSGRYDVIVSNDCGADTSAVATLVPCLAPVITLQPVALNVALGQNASFEVQASSAVGYQWFHDAAPLSDGGRISGAQTASLAITPVQAADLGAYHVAVYGLCDTVVTAAVALTNDCDPLAHANPPATMAAWWAMDPGVGNSVPDVFHPNNNKHHASLTGAATLVPGMVGTAVRCDGLEDGLHVPSTLAPDLARESSGLSIDAWIYPRSGSAANANRMVLQKGLGKKQTTNVGGITALAPGYAFYLCNDGRLGFQMPDPDYVPVRFEPAMPAMTMDAWHHVAVTVDPLVAGGGKFYVDGAQVAAFTPPSGILGNLADLYIGRFTPQWGPEFPASAFNGDIDEVELFTSAIDASDIQAIWAAACAGKRREMALVPTTIQVRKQTGQAEVCGSIGNFTTTPADYAWSLEVLPAGSGCPEPVPVTFTPSSGTISAGAGDYATVSTTAEVDPGYLFAPFTLCYRLTATNQSDGAVSIAEGTLVYYNSQTSGSGHCQPPQIGAPQLKAAPTRSAVRLGGLAKSGPAAPLSADAIFGSASFTIYNDAPGEITLDYQITTRDPDTDGPSSLLSLDGAPPGTPVTGSVTVAGFSQAQVPVGVGLERAEPFLRDEILLLADVTGDAVNETLASGIVRSAEDTSLVFLDVPVSPGPALRLSVSPNPFRGSAQILLSLPTAEHVDISVLDIVGRRVRHLHDGVLGAGAHPLSWDGRDESGRRRPPGLYFVSIRGATSGALTRKIVQMR